MKNAYKTMFASLCFIAVLAAFFFLFIGRIDPKHPSRMTKEEIEATDLSTNLVPITSSLFSWYPEKLYTPSDFETDCPEPGKDKAMYGTYRTTLKLPAGKTYGITGMACSYSQKVFINGEILSELGKVADNPEEFVPRTDSYSVFFTPQTEETEIIVWLAHWNNQNGYFNEIYLGEQDLVAADIRANFLASGLIIGALIAFAVFFFGIFLFYPVRRYIFWFSALCFSSGLYFFVFENKDIMVLLPKLPWAASHKIEYLCHLGTHIFVIVFVVSMLKIKFNKLLCAGFFTIMGGIGLFYLLAPSTFYSYHNVAPILVYSVTVLLAMAYILYKAFREKRFRHPENIIVLGCLLFDIVAYETDILTNRNYNLLPFITIVIIFFEAVAITMQFSRIEQELNLAMLREREISETNEMLSRMHDLKNSFFHNIAHEMKTPLTIMSGYAQLSAMEIQKDMVNEKTLQNLQTVSTEAMRLSDMVSKLMNISFDQRLAPSCTAIEVEAILQNAVAVCKPILAKNGNELEVMVETTKPVFSNGETLQQVFINLVVNANRHTRQGVIRFRVTDGGSFVIFHVENNGDQIPDHILAHIFEKGVSGDGGNGLGLAICQSILNQIGGEIRLDYTTKEKTCFSFTAPVFETT